MSEVVSFHGDDGPACAQAGVCDTSGTVSYSFGDVRDGGGSVLVTRNGRRSVGVRLRESLQLGRPDQREREQRARQRRPARRRSSISSTRSCSRGTRRRLRVLFHPALAAPDFLETYCAGPSDSDISHAGVIPTLSIPTNSLRRRRFTLSVASTKPFHSGPFTGTVSFNASFVLSRVRIPSDLLGFFAQAG